MNAHNALRGSSLVDIAISMGVFPSAFFCAIASITSDDSLLSGVVLGGCVAWGKENRISDLPVFTRVCSRLSLLAPYCTHILPGSIFPNR